MHFLCPTFNSKMVFLKAYIRSMGSKKSPGTQSCIFVRPSLTLHLVYVIYSRSSFNVAMNLDITILISECVQTPSDALSSFTILPSTYCIIIMENCIKSDAFLDGFRAQPFNEFPILYSELVRAKIITKVRFNFMF